MQYMRILELLPNAWNGNVLSRIRTLGSVDSSKICLLDQATTPNLLSMTYVVPSEECCVRNFRVLPKSGVLQANFRVTLVGRIADLQPLDQSLSGQEKRHFNIVDGSGLYIPVCATSRNALSDCLIEDSEVVLYYGVGRGMLGQTKGLLYCYKDALIIPTGKTFPGSAASKREELIIR